MHNKDNEGSQKAKRFQTNGVNKRYYIEIGFWKETNEFEMKRILIK